ncbi:antitoxin Xre-like helix-turn-helix domain-containing protein [Pontiella sp.]|uniref:type II RES/Xre toxin-antitoxin system antitoxin n=1 Tax=Pontiella sp. TaxID=2837462 RepID=UPI00356626BB
MKNAIVYPTTEEEGTVLMVEEPAVLFGRVDNREQVIRKIKKGLPAACFEKLRAEFGVTAAELAATLNINMRTLARRKQSGRLDVDESERVYRLARLFQIGLNLFEDPELTRRWFAAPKDIFGGLTPLNYADTEPGAQEVEKMLRRLEHGVFY